MKEGKKSLKKVIRKHSKEKPLKVDMPFEELVKRAFKPKKK